MGLAHHLSERLRDGARHQEHVGCARLWRSGTLGYLKEQPLRDGRIHLQRAAGQPEIQHADLYALMGGETVAGHIGRVPGSVGLPHEAIAPHEEQNEEPRSAGTRSAAH